MKLRTLTDGAQADGIPIKLDRIIHDAGKLANDQVKLRYSLRFGALGIFRGNIEDAFSYG